MACLTNGLGTGGGKSIIFDWDFLEGFTRLANEFPCGVMSLSDGISQCDVLRLTTRHFWDSSLVRAASEARAVNVSVRSSHIYLGLDSAMFDSQGTVHSKFDSHHATYSLAFPIPSVCPQKCMNLPLSLKSGFSFLFPYRLIRGFPAERCSVVHRPSTV